MILCGLTEAAGVFGISTQALANRRARDPSFPKPYVKLKMGPIWELKQLLEYKNAQEIKKA